MFVFSKQFWRFVMVGFTNTFNYYVLYLFFNHLLNMPYLGAHILAFLISMVGSFFLNSYFTYKTKPTLKKFLQFPLTYVVNFVVTTSGVFILVDILKLDENISPLLASVIAIPFTFIVSKMILLKEG
ncbi:GtrA family protein [Cytobacillus firmus]|uniref:Sugar translocase n=1 Tax=Cytobacillus firmus DS1 TaxID=1307436 RepID=W7L4F0_CYTFI|nr:GtrA family protein [Cytobacillus firmus]EWG10037.1 sugar translocase [Cytobacillus firmus DS1]